MAGEWPVPGKASGWRWGWTGVLAAVPPCSLASPLPSQHFALLLKYLIHVAIPDIPGWVAEEMAKLEYQRREAFKVRVGPGRAWTRGSTCPGSFRGTLARHPARPQARRAPI